MTTFIATNTNTATSNGFVFPGTDDELLIPLGVYIYATGTGFVGVTGPGGGTVQNNGEVAGHDAGISLGAANQTTTILNFSAGTVGSTAGPAIDVVATGLEGVLDIQNDGIVESAIVAIRVDGVGQIVNNGLVSSAGTGITQLGTVSSTSLFSLINGADGVIVGGYSAGGSLITEQVDNGGLINGNLVLGDGDGASFVNQAAGRLTGAALGSGGSVTFGDGDNDQFLNSGIMGALSWGDGDHAYALNYGTMGGIALGGGDHAFFGNAGTINGDVQLGNGTGQIFDSTAGWIYNPANANGASITAGSEGAVIVGALNGGQLVGGAGNDVLIANQTEQVGYDIVTTLDGKGGSNALYGGQGTNVFLSGDATYNQIWGGLAAVQVNGFTNNTVDYVAVTGAGRGVYVDLLNGNNAYIIDNGAYTFIDSIVNVPNVKGTTGVDIIQAGVGLSVIEGRGGGDHLYTGTGADTFLYTSNGDSNLVTGYDTISGFRSGIDKIDVSAFGLTSSHALIQSNATDTVLYLKMTSGDFDPTTDLAISFTGADALTTSDIVFAPDEPNGWSFYDYNSYFGTGYPDPSYMPTGTTAFTGEINVGIVLEREHDPTSMLQADWGTRQKALAALGDDPFSYYGASEESYQDLIGALDELNIHLSTNPAYESGAESRTAWVKLSAHDFEKLFGQELLYRDGDSGAIYWKGNLALNSKVADLGTVKGLSFDIDYGDVQLAGIDLPPEVLPDGSTAQGVELTDGRQGAGNDTAGAPNAYNPQDVAAFYNFPLVGQTVQTGKIGLIEPGMGADTFGAGSFDTLLDEYRTSIGVPTGARVLGQQNGGTQQTDTTERALDVGVATAINPTSTLVLYAGSGNQDNAASSAYTAYQSAFFDDDHAAVVSSSFRFGSSQPGADSPFLWAARELMVDAALRNITVFQSSGDGGSSYSTGNGLTNTANSRASEYSIIVGGTSISTGAMAAADPTLNGGDSAYTNYVLPALEGDQACLWQLVAGGLSVMPSLATDQEWFSEAIWNRYKLTDGLLDPSYLGNESGNGGVDYTQPTPWYQNALLPFLPPVTTDAAHAPGRGVPDVAGLASGNMDYVVPQPDLSSDPTRGDGGTSAATPLWASLAVQINAVFHDQHLPDLGYMTDLLYIAAAVAPASFNDVTIGNDTSSFVMGGDVYKAMPPGGSGSPECITPTGAGYTAGPGYDLASGLGSPNGLLLARALTAIAQAQLNYSDSPDIADLHNGAWESGVHQTLLVQTTFPNATGAVSVNAGGDILGFTSQASDSYAWTSRFAGQVAQESFDDALVTLFDQQSQGTLGQLTVDAGDALSVAINGSVASGATGLLTSDFGFIDFQTADGNSVRLARPVAVAETVVAPIDDPSPTGTTIVRLRQADTDSLAVRFYKVDDYVGTVGGVAPGDANYAAAAASTAYTVSPLGGGPAQTWLSGPGYGGYQEATIDVQQGDIIAMELQNLTTGNTYWAFSQANETVAGQQVGHLWNYGMNTWGWEAGQGGGDFDFNDLVVQLDFTSAYGSGYLLGVA